MEAPVAGNADRSGSSRQGQAGNDSSQAAARTFAVTPPSISLPKGGGAIRGIGEKFAANPVTGTGSMSIPLSTSPGRLGFGPQLSLSYDSGAGNGPFGFGWTLSLPQITRKTDKGLPRYDDASDSDVFILSGAEDLVPLLRSNAHGELEIDEDDRTVGAVTYHVRRFRPRIEGLFARIERWTNATSGEMHWRSISKDNIVALYGKTSESRIADPADSNRIFAWLICQSHDDKGNAIRYRYVPETSDGIAFDAAHEANRTFTSRSTNRYLKRIHYGNTVSLLANGQSISPLGPDLTQLTWLFEVVFDYGEGHYESLTVLPDDPQFTRARPIAPATAWPVRRDAFSSCRAGFEVRTYRLCRRVLMFHHFATELGTPDYLVHSTEFAYREMPIASFIVSVTESGYLRQPLPNQPDRYLKKSLPPLEFQYSEATIDPTVREVAPGSMENLPTGLDSAAYQWVDLDGEGIPGILTEQAHCWFYKRNLSPINTVGTNGDQRIEASFAHVEQVTIQPSLSLAGNAQFMDLAGDGHPDVVTFEGPTPGFYERTKDAKWEPFRSFRSFPTLDTRDANLKFVDLNGDGHTDVTCPEILYQGL